MCMMRNKLTKILQYNIQILLQKLCYFHWLLSTQMWTIQKGLLKKQNPQNTSRVSPKIIWSSKNGAVLCTFINNNRCLFEISNLKLNIKTYHDILHHRQLCEHSAIMP